MKTHYHFISLILLLLNAPSASGQIQPGDTIWTNIFPENSFRDVIEATDGNIFALSDIPPKIYKTDSLGNLLWTKSYSFDSNDGGYALCPTESGGFILAGTNRSLAPVNKDIWVIKCDSNGDTIWTGRYNPPGFDAYAVGYQIHTDSEGNYFICGFADSSPGNQDMILVKISADGEFRWSRTYGGNFPEEATDFGLLSDGGCVLSGYTRSFGGVSRALYVVRTDSNGDTVWTKVIVRNNEQWGRGIAVLPNDDFIVGGWTGTSSASKDIWLLKFDSNGDTIWTNILTSTQGLTQINSIILSNGNIAFTGAVSGSITVGKTDGNGNLLWLNNFGNYVGLAITQMADGNFLVGGQKAFMQAWILKVLSGDPPLPVELSSFNVSLNGSSVQLNWTTASEMNNRGFEIERTVSSRQLAVSDWESIGFVKGKGSTTELQNYFFSDKKVLPGKYLYRLKQIDFDGSFEYSNEIEVEITHPTEFVLYQNYPNPFNPSTIIKYAVSSTQFTTLKIYDILGKEIATLVNEEKTPGAYEVEFNTSLSSELSSGVYFYKLHAADFTATKKMILIR